MSSSVVQSAQQRPFEAISIPIIPQPRNAAATAVSPQSTIALTRLLDSIEKQLDEQEHYASSITKEDDPWRFADLAIALTHATTQVSRLPFGSNTVALRDRVDLAHKRYNALQAPQGPGPALNNTKLVQYLLEPVVNDSDTDSEYEEELRQVDRAGKSSEANRSSALGTTQVPGGNAEQGETGAIRSRETEQDDDDDDDDDDDGLEAYEAATGLRRRRNELERKHEAPSGKTSERDEEAPPTALQSERSIQDALSGELLRMAGVLKTNSVKFADALERDRKALEAADEKLQGNLTLMTRTRGRLGEYSRKARSMGWITLGSVAAVCMSWVLMFLVIRLT